MSYRELKFSRFIRNWTGHPEFKVAMLAASGWRWIKSFSRPRVFIALAIFQGARSGIQQHKARRRRPIKNNRRNNQQCRAVGYSKRTRALIPVTGIVL